jgi:hypothetical protein
MNSTKNRICDRAEILKMAALILRDGQVTELRALDASTVHDRRPHTISGYFNDANKLADAVEQIKSAKGIYVIPNPVKPALLGRSVNKARAAGKDPTTSDTDIARRMWLLIDCDPMRPAGIASSDDEHDAALARLDEIVVWLTSQGFAPPITADSGNGAHAMYRVDLPADDAGLIERVLDALAQRFDDDVVKVDTGVFNPARIWKLYGTLAGKGDAEAASIGRPHRMSKIITVPDELVVVKRELLEAIAGDGPDQAGDAVPIDRPRSPSGSSFDLDDWIRQHALDVTGPQPWKASGLKWVFNVCPWNSDHTNGSAFIVRWPNGKIGAGCHHDGCKGKDWHSLRDLVEPRRQADRRQLKGQHAGTPPAATSWSDPQPLPNDKPPVMSFDFDLLPASLRPWVRDIAERIQCPPDFPAVATMIGLASVVGRKIGIRPNRRDDWLVVPNLWGAVIGRPGVMKTPAIAEPLKPLKRLEIEAKRDFDDSTQNHEAEKLVAEATRKASSKKIEKLIKDNDQTAALSLANELVAGDQPQPVRRRYMTNDSTVEKIGEILSQNPNGVLVYRDELVGLLRSLDKEGQEGARSFYLEAWNGTGRYSYDRITRGTLDIEAAIVSVFGGIQPGPLRDYLRGAVHGGRGDDGLIQRFQLAVWPDVSREWRNVDSWPDSAAKKVAFGVFTRLKELVPLAIGATADEDDLEGIPYLRFSDEALAVFVAWREPLEARLRDESLHPALESHLSKFRSLIPSLALLIHLADDRLGPVEEDALQRAIAWGEYLESHARRIYAVAINPAPAAARALGKKLIDGELKDGFALRDVYRNGWSALASKDDATAAVELLTDLDWLRPVEMKTPGRTGVQHFINPRIWKSQGTAPAKTDKSAPAEHSVGFVSPLPGPVAEFSPDVVTELNQDEVAEWRA